MPCALRALPSPPLVHPDVEARHAFEDQQTAMTPPTVLALEARQSQTLTPRLQQAVRQLQLSTLDFSQELQQLAVSNPFLDVDGDASYESDAPADEGDPGPQAETEREDDYPESAADGANAQRRNDDGIEALDFVCAPVTLRQHLHTQINVLGLAPREHFLAWIVAESLDDDGYLRVDLDSLRDVAALDPRADTREILAALARVQRLDPAGVGARDVQECLKLQLARLPASREQKLAARIVGDSFRHLVHRDVQRLARELGCSTTDVEAACALIRRLAPRPGSRFSDDAAAAITPDVVVRKLHGTWTAMLNPAVVPRLSLNRTYADLFKRHRQSHHFELAAQLREARWTLQNIEQRFATILRVAQTLVERQQNFFELGTMAMQPLGLKDIAQALDLHESTVSRATCNKYMLTPVGVFELKYFLSRSLSTDQGSRCSTTAIREAIRKMISAEDRNAPHSDADITRLLQQQGLQVARRTVTKYRQMMNIPSVDMRRTYS